jgi:hypothetical protein
MAGDDGGGHESTIRPLSYVDPTTDSQLAKGRLPVDHRELTFAFGTAVQARNVC